jgi:hypothetical protein
MRVDKGRLLHETMVRLVQLEEGGGVFVQSFKKDRSILVTMQEGMYLVLERGFIRKDFVVETKKIRKLLKSLYRKEFPHSHKLWLILCTSGEIRELIRK